MIGSSIHTDVSLNADFNAGAALPKKKTRKKRTPPLSIRLTDKERVWLENMAAGQALSAYIKAVIFSGKKTPRRRSPIEDSRKLAMALGMLGKMNMLTKLTDFLDALEQGSADVPADVQQEIMHACSDIRLIRYHLITALGIKAEE
ncbi:MAG: hypothetical protein R3D71_08400 [Rickettsiales bacterium]